MKRALGRLLRDRWRLAFAVAVAVCALVYALNLASEDPLAGSVWGLSYGIAAALLLLATALYGVRRRAMRLVSRWHLGSARGWLGFHLYGGLLFFLLMLMHSAFRLPTGALTGWLWGLSLWVTLSGLAGRLLQQWIPRVLSSGLELEANYDRIPQLVEEISVQARKVAAASPPSLQALYERTVEPAVRAPQRRFKYFIDITGGVGVQRREFDYLRGFLAGEEERQLDRLEQLFCSKLELDAHYTLQQPLRWWLYLHVPPSILLLLLVLVHVATVLYY